MRIVTDRILFGSVLLILVLVPLIFGKALLFPFVVYRTYIFFILVDLIFVACLFRYDIRWKVKIKHPIWRALLIFLGIKIISDIAGTGISESIFGNYERMMGLLTWA